MKSLIYLLPVAVVTLSSCMVADLNRAMDCNRCAIQRSTEAINRNVEATEKVTENLRAMQAES